MGMSLHTHLGRFLILALKVVRRTVGTLISRHLTSIAYLTWSGTGRRQEKEQSYTELGGRSAEHDSLKEGKTLLFLRRHTSQAL